MKMWRRCIRGAWFFVLGMTVPFGAFGADKNEVIFKVANGEALTTLDPAYVNSASDERVFQALFEGLVGRSPNGGAATPGLADSWSVATDGLTWTFRLRPAIWSDGFPITASTVVESWLRELDPKTKAQGVDLLTHFVDGALAYNEGKTGPTTVQIRAVDLRTFRVKMTQPLIPLSILSQAPFAVVPVHIIKKEGEKWTSVENFVSNGPFRLESWKKDGVLVAVRNPRYWNVDTVKIQKIVFLPLDDDTAWSRFKKDEVDWDTHVGADHLGDAVFLEAFQNSPSLETYSYIPNETIKPLDDPRIRSALSLAIDRNQLIDQVLKSGEFPLYSICPSLYHYVPPEGAHDNILEAQSLLAEAGYPGGKEFPKLTLGFNESERHRAIAVFVISQWKKNLGIEVEPKPLVWKDFLAGQEQHKWGLIRSDWLGEWSDPLAFLSRWRSRSSNNLAGYKNADFDALLAQARYLPDGAERLQTLAQAETMLGNDQASIPLFVEGHPQLINLTKWAGWYNNTADVHPWQGLEPRK